MIANPTTIAGAVVSVVLACTTVFQEYRVITQETAKVQMGDSCSVALSHLMEESYERQQRNQELVDKLLICVSE